MINTIGKIILCIILMPFLWIYFGFKMLKNKERRNRNNLIICAISFIVMIICLNAPTDSKTAINTANNRTGIIESSNIETTTIETTTLETTIAETTTLETTAAETTALETTAAETAAPEPAIIETTERLVWITKTGSKYHSYDSCGNTNPSDARQVPLSEAEAAGYEPCKRC